MISQINCNIIETPIVYGFKNQVEVHISNIFGIDRTIKIMDSISPFGFTPQLLVINEAEKYVQSNK